MIKLIQLATGLAVGFFLIHVRDSDPTAASLRNPYVIGVLSLFAAFAVTALPMGLYRDIPRWWRLWKGEKPLGAQEGLHKGISRNGSRRSGK